MDLKTIIKSLRAEIKFEKDSGSELKHISWPYQEGILISVNDLEKILDVCDGKLSDTEKANELLPLVSDSEAAVCSDPDLNNPEDCKIEHCCYKCKWFLEQTDC